MTSKPVSTARALASRSRLLILRALRFGGGTWDIDRIASEVGLHPNTAREHLQTLERAGFVHSQAVLTRGRGRPRLVYEAWERSAGFTLDERLRDRMLDSLLESYGPGDNASSQDAPDGGYSGAAPLSTRPSAVRQMAKLELHFEDLGFDPEFSEVPLALHFYRCPMMSLVRRDTELVCAVHEDLARGVLAQQPGPIEVESLRPFVEPRHCVLRLLDNGQRPSEEEGDAPAGGE